MLHRRSQHTPPSFESTLHQWAFLDHLRCGVSDLPQLVAELWHKNPSNAETGTVHTWALKIALELDRNCIQSLQDDQATVLSHQLPAQVVRENTYSIRQPCDSEL